jgi:hypothetical protein
MVKHPLVGFTVRDFRPFRLHCLNAHLPLADKSLKPAVVRANFRSDETEHNGLYSKYQTTCRIVIRHIHPPVHLPMKPFCKSSKSPGKTN